MIISLYLLLVHGNSAPLPHANGLSNFPNSMRLVFGMHIKDDPSFVSSHDRIFGIKILKT